MLTGKRILVVEDQQIIAQRLVDALEDAGAVLVDSVGTISEAIATIARSERIDAALLDVNLGGEMSYPIAYDLARRKIPFAFLTAYDSSVVAARFQNVPIFEKPVELDRILRSLAEEIGRSPESGQAA